MAKKRKVKKVVNAAPEVVESQAAPAPKPAAAKAAQKITSVSELITDQVWLISGVVISLVAALLRFVQLDLKPFHHDEGVNGFFLRTLFNDGIYKYQPDNYHGPTLYYISLAFAKVFGLETIPVRVSMAIFGLLMVVMVLFLRRYIGNAGSLIAALFVALSPGMVFISRYFIHEIFFVFLSLTLVVAVVYYVEKRKAGPFAIGWAALLLLICYAPSTVKLAAFMGGENTSALWAFRIVFFIVEAVLAYLVLRLLLSWDGGRAIYLMLASASVALFFGTKETAFITLGTMMIAVGSVWVWRRIAPDAPLKRNGFSIALALSTLAVGIVFLSGSFSDAYTWLSNSFLPNGRPAETFVFVSIIILLVAAAVAWVLFLMEQRSGNTSEIVEPVELTGGTFLRTIGSNRDIAVTAGLVILTFAYVSVLFFTSFFTYAEGVTKAFEAYAIWTKTGNKDHTMHGWAGYLKWGMKLESAIIIVGLLGAFVAMVKAKHRFAMFAGLWAFGLMAAYSIIPYKTPWLALSFFLPMCIIAGYGLNELLDSKNIRLKGAAILMAVVGTAVLSYQTYQLNFVRYDDDDMSYVYAHTKRAFLDLVSEIERYAEKSGKGTEAQIEFVTPDYWPMTWYMNDYKRAFFQGRLVDATTAEMIVAKKKDQDAAVIQKYSNHYKFVGVYALRPGVDLMLLVRNDLAEPTAQDLSKITEAKNSP